MGLGVFQPAHDLQRIREIAVRRGAVRLERNGRLQEFDGLVRFTLLEQNDPGIGQGLHMVRIIGQNLSIGFEGFALAPRPMQTKGVIESHGNLFRTLAHL